MLVPSPPACQECELCSVPIRDTQVSALEVAWNQDAGKGGSVYRSPANSGATLRKNPRVILGTKEILLPLVGSDNPFWPWSALPSTERNDLATWSSRDYYIHFMDRKLSPREVK